MNSAPGRSLHSPQTASSNQSNGMISDLRDDAASKTAPQSETLTLKSKVSSVPIARTSPQRSASGESQPEIAHAEVESIVVKAKPFGMSYDGMSQADYIAYRISLGAR
jgi:hypothetical protein